MLKKSKLRQALEIRITNRQAKKWDTIIYDVSALLWSISWPKEGSTLSVYINYFQVFIHEVLPVADIILVFDRYFQNSTRTHTRLQRQGTEGMSRVHILMPDMLILPRSCILQVVKNKKKIVHHTFRITV